MIPDNQAEEMRESLKARKRARVIWKKEQYVYALAKCEERLNRAEYEINRLKNRGLIARIINREIL